jgi:hypothetical protein
MLGPAKQDSKEPPNMLVKSVLQNKAITKGNVAEFKRIEVEDVENLNIDLEDNDAFWEDLGVKDLRSVTSPNSEGEWDHLPPEEQY